MAQKRRNGTFEVLAGGRSARFGAAGGARSTICRALSRPGARSSAHIWRANFANEDGPARASPTLTRSQGVFASSAMSMTQPMPLRNRRSLSSRGYGKRRLEARAAGGRHRRRGRRCSATNMPTAQAVDAALSFAKRRKIGPFAVAELDRSSVKKRSPRWSGRAIHSALHG